MNINIKVKIKRLRDAAKIADTLKKEGKKVVQCHGAFDLLHPGHIRHFQSAKRLGDILIVTITGDEYIKKGPGRPIFTQDLRAEVLSAVEYIDYVVIVDSDSAIESIKKIKPNFYVKGPDYKYRKENAFIPRKLELEKEAIESVGGKLIFTEDIVFSSSRLINEHLDVYPPKTKKYLDILKSRYTSDYIIERLSSMHALNVLVIGDAIVDQYHYCLPMGKSSKEPIMVHQYVSEESFAGGSLATANHTAALSRNVSLLTLLGKKRSLRSFIVKHLNKAVHPTFFYQPGSSTIVKKRYLDAFTKQKLFQVSYLKDEPPAHDVEKQIIKFLKNEIKKYDLVVVNDFGHGLLTEKIIKVICVKANYLALNVQANSANYGFNVITKYKRADFICIDDQEIRLALHDKYSDLTPLIKKIYKKMKCKNLIVTKGPKGSISYSEKQGIHEAPALTDKIIDRVGAGDALFAVSSPCVYSGMEQELAAFVGNVAGALQVQIVGNRKPIELVDLTKFITRLLK